MLDRFDYEPFALAPEYRCIRNRLNEQAREAPLSFEAYRERYSAKTDHAGTVEDYLGWMREAGFDAACLYQLFNRALIAARPRAGPGTSADAEPGARRPLGPASNPALPRLRPTRTRRDLAERIRNRLSPCTKPVSLKRDRKRGGLIAVAATVSVHGAG